MILYFSVGSGRLGRSPGRISDHSREFSAVFSRERALSGTLERFYSAFPARTCTVLDLGAAQGQADTHKRFYVRARPTRRSDGCTGKGFKRAFDRTDLREKVRRRSGRRSVGYADGGAAAARKRGAAATASAAGSSGKGLSSGSLSPGRGGGGCCRPGWDGWCEVARARESSGPQPARRWRGATLRG